MAAEDLRVVQEYGPEHAGDLVGWSNVHRNEFEQGPDSLIATIALARIGGEGAQYSISEYQPGKFGYHPSYIKGFEDCAELTISAFETSERIDTRAGKVPRWTREVIDNGDPYNIKHRRFTDDFGHNRRPEDGNGEWALGSDAILASIKAQLSAEAAAFMYPIAYYTLAVMADADMQLVDTSMHTQTIIEVALAKHRAQQLSELLASDWQVVRNFKHITPANHQEYTDEFVASRRHMHTVESELSWLMDVTMVRGRMATPVGHGHASRTWPFMDASESNERAAFGRELDALQRHQYKSPTHAVEREVAELSARATFAQLQADQLDALWVKESLTQEQAD